MSTSILILDKSYIVIYKKSTNNGDSDRYSNGNSNSDNDNVNESFNIKMTYI